MEVFLFIAGVAFVPAVLAAARLMLLYTVVHECRAHVYTFFGKVVGVIDEPGLHILPMKFGPKALLFRLFGREYVVSTALRQYYLRDQMVNSSEGTPMGIGIWYETRVADPVAYLFANSDPAGSMRANVANATVSTLSNLELEEMLEDRHRLSRSVRERLSGVASNWGFELGSIYIRKVAFTDKGMISEITAKVVNRLRQVTAAIRQNGENQVNLIRSEAGKRASEQLALARALRPRIIGETLAGIRRDDPHVADALAQALEIEALAASGAAVVLVPEGVGAPVPMVNVDGFPPAAACPPASK